MKIQEQFPEGAFLTLEQGERKTEVLSELIWAERGPPGLTMREGFPTNPLTARKMGRKPSGHFNLKGSHVHPTVALQDIPKTCSKNSSKDSQSATEGLHNSKVSVYNSHLSISYNIISFLKI